MDESNSKKRFGFIAMKNGFITKEQFVEAMGMQMDVDIETEKHTLIGNILVEMGMLTKWQQQQVLLELEEYSDSGS